MKVDLIPAFVLACLLCGVAAGQNHQRAQAEYYAAAYARHFHVPLDFLRALIAQESGWQSCAISKKGAVGVMQIMPETARRLGAGDLCDLNQNISAGVRHLARLIVIFHGDLRLVAAAYNAGKKTIQRRGLSYANRDVVAYVERIRRDTESLHSLSKHRFRPETILQTSRRKP